MILGSSCSTHYMTWTDSCPITNCRVIIVNGIVVKFRGTKYASLHTYMENGIVITYVITCMLHVLIRLDCKLILARIS